MSQEIKLAEQKKQIREFLKEQRASITPKLHAEYSEIITEKVLQHPRVQGAKTIFGFISWSDEVNTHDLIKTFLAQQKTVLVPKIISRETMHAQVLRSWSDLVEGKLGILTLADSCIEELASSADVIITPGLGFTEKGARIGFGAGYYDRWFSSSHPSFKLAIAFEKQIVGSLPVEPTDIPVDEIITEKRQIIATG